MTSNHKSEDFKLSAVEYYLVGDKSQLEVCRIFKCTPRSLIRWVNKYNNKLTEIELLASRLYNITNFIIDDTIIKAQIIENIKEFYLKNTGK